jgi:site-specific recombinase XerD
MKHSVKFYPEKRKDKKSGQIIEKNVPIILCVFYAGRRIPYYTGQRCDLRQWNEDNQRIRINNTAPNGQTATNFNNDLDKIKVTVNDLFKCYDVAGIVPEVNQFRKDLDKTLKPEKGIIAEVRSKRTFFEYFKQYIDDAPLSPERKKHIKTTLNKVTKFNEFTTFEMITPEYLYKFQNDLKITHLQSKNTIISEMRRLRAFMGYCVRNGWIDNNPFRSFKIEAESYGDPVYLTITERDKLFFAEIESERLSRVRDIFVLQCFIGCRVGDFVKLHRNNIIDGCIEYIAGKTKEDKPRIARVPLSPKAWEIINKYDLPGGELVPYISGQKYNVYLKELFRKVELTRMVTVADKKTRLSTVIPISELATSHMARRVFVGNLHKIVKNEVIASMSGHVENSRAFSRYYTIDKADQVEAIKLIE